MARIYIAAGPYIEPDTREVIDHICADEAAIEELLKRLRRLATVDQPSENSIRQLVCFERCGKTPTIRPEDVNFKLTLSGRHYTIYATFKAKGEEPGFPGPDIQLQAQTRHPNGKYDHRDSIQVEATSFTQPNWALN